MIFTPHTKNGKKYGGWYVLDDGRQIYLAWRRPKQIYFKKMAWCLDNSTLNEAKDRACAAIGVAVKEGKKVSFYLTRLEDFFGPDSFINRDNTAQRGLPLNRFRITPASKPAHVASLMRLR